MKILLINPPFHRLKGFGHTYYPLGLGYLCGVAKTIEMDAHIYNAEAPSIGERVNHSENYNQKIKSHIKYIDALHDNEHYVWQEIRDVVTSYRPDIVGITVMTAKYSSASKVSEIVKEVNPNIKTIWGGPHPTICTEEVLAEQLVDFVISGEGEETFKELLLQLQKGEKNFRLINGLGYKEDGNCLINSGRELIENIDSLPLPDRENIIYHERYFPNSFGNMITLRGCPFHCGYCGAKNIWSKKCRYRDVDKLFLEIRLIKEKYGSREFYFWDDSFTLNRNRVITICNRLIKESLNITWGCTTRVDLLDDEVLHLMKRAGCNYISIGVESGSDRILKIIEKNITVKQVKKAVTMIKNSKIFFEAFFMIGFPDETKDDIDKTFQLMKDIDGGTVCFSVFTPYPGSNQFDVAKKYGLIPANINWSDYSHHSSENCFVKNISKEEFKDYVDKISQWIDKKNAKDSKISLLFLKTINEFPHLIKRPTLFFHKCNTFLGICKKKLLS